MSDSIDALVSEPPPAGVPVGTIVMWGGSIGNLQEGWMVCDGTPLSQSAYPTLYGVIAANFGQGAKAGEFFLPDLQGRFIRGFDNGTNRDPDSATRTDMHSGVTVGDKTGSIQGDNVGPHTHEYSRMFDEQGDCEAGSSWHRKDASTGNPEKPAGSETRPINAYLIFIIYAGQQAS